MLEIAVDELARLPDIQIGNIPSLHTLFSQFRKDSRFLAGYKEFLQELRSLGAPTVKPSFWPLRYSTDLTVNFLVAMDQWGYHDRQVRSLPINEHPSALVYLSGGMPVLYREIGMMVPKVDGIIGAPLPPEYAAAIGYNAAYEQSLQASTQQDKAA